MHESTHDCCGLLTWQNLAISLLIALLLGFASYIRDLRKVQARQGRINVTDVYIKRWCLPLAIKLSGSVVGGFFAFTFVLTAKPLFFWVGPAEIWFFVGLGSAIGWDLPDRLRQVVLSGVDIEFARYLSRYKLFRMVLRKYFDG